MIRQAIIHDFIKTSAAIRDEQLLDNASTDMWEDWSEELKRVGGAGTDSRSARLYLGQRRCVY